MKRILAVLPAVFLAFAGIALRDAAACGCLAPPDPSVPIVQAGEKILFAMENGSVTAHIQIQYAGTAEDFGWLLPLPNVPTLELGTDELFAQLYATTQPKYKLVRKYEGNCGFGPNGGFGANSSGGGGNEDGRGGPLVLADSIGPYDYAVLHADNKTEMLNWLTANHYFVPAGTDAVVDQYIHPGAYFLALKLRSGASTGELQPVVVRYPSDLPMIPIVLTSVAAQPNMGIQVWMLGQGRAIPRNYYHTVVDDALIDWNRAGINYNDVIIKAVGEAEGRHSFVTEYAGTSEIMRNLLNAQGRFGNVTELAASSTAFEFVAYLFTHQYGVVGQQNGPVASFQLTSQLTSILGKYIPEPPGLVRKQIKPSDFYQSLSYYLSDSYRAQNPGDFVGWTGINYQPQQMAAEINERVIQPTLKAGALFDGYPYLTRLYTTLSPKDMTKDPVFSFNPGLPDISNEHTATWTYHCGVLMPSQNAAATAATLVTEQGWQIEYPDGAGTSNTFAPPRPDLPGSLRIEILREEGPPQVLVDNSNRIASSLSEGGCEVAPGGRTRGALGLFALLFALGLVVAVVRRKRGH